MDTNLLEALGKKYVGEILTILDEPMPAEDISEETGIPIATVYRRLSTLEEQDLVDTDQVYNGSNNKIKAYYRTIDHVTVDFSDTDEELDVTTENIRTRNRLAKKKSAWS